jgi:hypothetical protein
MEPSKEITMTRALLLAAVLALGCSCDGPVTDGPGAMSFRGLHQESDRSLCKRICAPYGDYDLEYRGLEPNMCTCLVRP